MNWNLEGLFVEGMYISEFPVIGKVVLSRVKYGGGVQHHVVLETPIEVYGVMRDRITLDHDEIDRVMSSLDEVSSCT